LDQLINSNSLYYSDTATKSLSSDPNNSSLNQILDNATLNNINTIQTNPLVLAKPVGLSLKIAGRLAKDRIQPRKTLKTITVGNLNMNRVDFVEKSSFSSKNRRGTYTITVKMAHSRV